MPRKQPAPLSAQAIDAIESALFSHVAQANTALRRMLASEWSELDSWVMQRTKGLSALREVLTYAEAHSLKSPGAANSMCTMVSAYCHTERE